jgi:hypothetical protein
MTISNCQSPKKRAAAEQPAGDERLRPEQQSRESFEIEVPRLTCVPPNHEAKRDKVAAIQTLVGDFGFDWCRADADEAAAASAVFKLDVPGN